MEQLCIPTLDTAGGSGKQSRCGKTSQSEHLPGAAQDRFQWDGDAADS